MTARTAVTMGLFSLTLLLGITATLPAEEYLSYRLRMYVLAHDRDSLSTTVAQWADDHGGYFVERSSESVVLRIPRERLPLLRTTIEESGALVLRFEPSAVDVRDDLSAARAAIQSRQEALDRILVLMATADVGATLDFEQELRSLNSEIEYYRGRERQLVNDTRYAWVRVALTTESSSIPDLLPSSFGWINTVDLYRFLESRS